MQLLIILHNVYSLIIFNSDTLPLPPIDKPTDVQKTIRESYTLQNKQTEEPSSAVSNHLSIPKPMDMNPNLLSPEVLGQRRGTVCSTIMDRHCVRQINPLIIRV